MRKNIHNHQMTRDLYKETSNACWEEERFQLKDFNEMQKRSTAANVRDRTSLKYLYVKLFSAYNRLFFNPCWFNTTNFFKLSFFIAKSTITKNLYKPFNNEYNNVKFQSPGLTSFNTDTNLALARVEC